MTEIRLPPDALLHLVTDRWTEPFWAAAREHRLTAARCAGCATYRMPPTPFCPRCHAQALDWPTLSGRGTLYSFTVVRRLAMAGAEAHLPYVPCVVTPDDAPDVRLISCLVGCTTDRIRIGMALHVGWHDRPDGITTHHFRPREPS
ncbi:MAG: OB-fold domain-containing protein [Pseudooceanicola sp.]|nr:OB-fold domain-containing protein [Pseudooceanicola sp.]